MSCWVVPAIAAELWGVTINHVLAGVRDGTFASRQEHGFVFVDVAPGSFTYLRPRRPGEPTPATFVPVPRDEAAAEPSGTASAVEDDELPPLDEEEDATPLPPRDAVRAAVARQRRRPAA